MSPPSPVEHGSVTFSAAATATAASAAFPPFSRIETPALTASGWLAATHPLRDKTGDRRETNCIQYV